MGVGVGVIEGVAVEVKSGVKEGLKEGVSVGVKVMGSVGEGVDDGVGVRVGVHVMGVLEVGEGVEVYVAKGVPASTSVDLMTVGPCSQFPTTSQAKV